MAITYNNLYLNLRQRFRAAGDLDNFGDRLRPNAGARTVMDDHDARIRINLLKTRHDRILPFLSAGHDGMEL